MESHKRRDAKLVICLSQVDQLNILLAQLQRSHSPQLDLVNSLVHAAFLHESQRVSTFVSL